MTRCPVCDQEMPPDGWTWREGLRPSCRLFAGAPAGWELSVWSEDRPTEPWQWAVRGPSINAQGRCDRRDGAMAEGRAALAFLSSLVTL